MAQGTGGWRRIYPSFETPISRSLRMQLERKDHDPDFLDPRGGSPLAVIILGQIPFFFETADEAAKAEISRFFARYCEGVCSMDPVAVPEHAVEIMTGWRGEEVSATGRPDGWIVPDWSVRLRAWVDHGVWTSGQGLGSGHPATAPSATPRQASALRRTFRLLAGAPFGFGDRVRNISVFGWGRNRSERTGEITSGPFTHPNDPQRYQLIPTPSRSGGIIEVPETYLMLVKRFR